MDDEKRENFKKNNPTVTCAWDSAVLKIFKSKKAQKASVQDIYLEVGKYRKLGNWELEDTKWGEPRYHHIVRATLNQLHTDGLIERIKRGVYFLKVEELT